MTATEQRGRSRRLRFLTSARFSWLDLAVVLLLSPAVVAVVERVTA